ncbi:hypothetical protein FACS1894184_21350 [Clostridia bacterium]|nr:hypothetical protein FACS1894184_21350 [Clostridia bacterium]
MNELVLLVRMQLRQRLGLSVIRQQLRERSGGWWKGIAVGAVAVVGMGTLIGFSCGWYGCSVRLSLLWG